MSHNLVDRMLPASIERHSNATRRGAGDLRFVLPKFCGGEGSCLGLVGRASANGGGKPTNAKKISIGSSRLNNGRSWSNVEVRGRRWSNESVSRSTCDLPILVVRLT